MTEALISIIVPIFKVEKELPQCIDSLINQTYKNIEIILVDDGSPDKCPAICDEYAKFDKRIRVIHKTNGGLSDARNTGIDVAVGEYIGFVDSDDYIDSQMFERLYYAAVENNCDISECYSISFNDETVPTAEYNNNVLLLDPLKWLTESNLKGFLNCVAWNKLYKKNLFNDIRYPKGKLNEDEATTYKLIYKSKKIARLSDKLYFYRKRSGSIMLSTMTEKRIYDKYDALKNRCVFFDNLNETQMANFSYAKLSLYMSNVYKYISISKKNKWLKEIDVYYKLIRKDRSVPLKYKLYIKTFLLSPSFISKYFSI